MAQSQSMAVARELVQEKQSGVERPAWLSQELYPFSSRWWESGEGRMHYVDEGVGEVVLFVHGTPSWSFLYRDMIKALSGSMRCIALDHLGFGLSDKPKEGAYHVRDHSARLEAFIEHLGVEKVHLVVHDFGGPIGLSYALRQPQKIQTLTLFNTWMWSLAEDKQGQQISRFVSGWLGRFLYRQLNFSPKVLVKAGFHDKGKLSREVHKHYMRPFGRASERMAPWTFGSILADPWFGTLWEEREVLRDIPSLLLWGMKDIAFKPDSLGRWKELLSQHRAVEFPEAGHFPQEEATTEVIAAMQEFLRDKGVSS